MKLLKIDLHKDMDRIINGVNLLRLGNNPIKINGKDIVNILLDKN